MAMTKQIYINDRIIFNIFEELVPEEYLVRKLDNCMNFKFIEEIVGDLYTIG